DGLKHLEEIIIRFADLATEELDDADNLVPASDRKPKCGMKPFFRRVDRPWKIGGENYVGKPYRFPVRPDSPRKTHAGRKRGRPGDGLELRSVQLRDVPEFDAA